MMTAVDLGSHDSGVDKKLLRYLLHPLWLPLHANYLRLEGFTKKSTNIFVFMLVCLYVCTLQKLKRTVEIAKTPEGSSCWRDYLVVLLRSR